MLWSVDSFQNSVSTDQYRLTVSRVQVSTHWVRVLFWNYPLTSYYFSNDRRLKFNFFLKACEISYVHRLHHYNFDFKLTPDVKIRPAITCREGSRFWLFSPWSRIVQAFRLIFMLWLVKIWQVSSCRKCMQLLKTCFLIAETDRVLCRQLVTFLTVFFHWIYKMKFSCYQESSVIQPKYNLTYFVWNKAAPDQSWPGQDLIPKCSVKDLGITPDSNISFNNHVNDLTLTLLHK